MTLAWIFDGLQALRCAFPSHVPGKARRMLWCSASRIFGRITVRLPRGTRSGTIPLSAGNLLRQPALRHGLRRTGYLPLKWFFVAVGSPADAVGGLSHLELGFYRGSYPVKSLMVFPVPRMSTCLGTCERSRVTGERHPGGESPSGRLLRFASDGPIRTAYERRGGSNLIVVDAAASIIGREVITTARGPS